MCLQQSEEEAAWQGFTRPEQSEEEAAGQGVTRPEQSQEKAAAHLDRSTAESQGLVSGGGAAATDRVGSVRAMALGPGMEGSGPGPQEADWSRRSSGAELCLRI